MPPNPEPEPEPRGKNEYLADDLHKAARIVFVATHRPLAGGKWLHDKSDEYRSWRDHEVEVLLSLLKDPSLALAPVPAEPLFWEPRLEAINITNLKRYHLSAKPSVPPAKTQAEVEGFH